MTAEEEYSPTLNAWKIDRSPVLVYWTSGADGTMLRFEGTVSDIFSQELHLVGKDETAVAFCLKGATLVSGGRKLRIEFPSGSSLNLIRG
jgi:hypothetical protein